MSIQDAVAKGALAFFGDKYGEQVRVVTVESFSKELCGGTHCRQTGDIGLFRIVSETGVAAGVRRIEAQTGSGAFALMKKLEADIRELSDLLKVGQSELVSKTRKVMEQLKDKERALEELQLKMAAGSMAPQGEDHCGRTSSCAEDGRIRCERDESPGRSVAR